MKSKVYFIETNSCSEQKVADSLDKLVKTHQLLSFVKENDFVAIKLHVGEKQGRYFLNSRWIKPVIDLLKEKTRHCYLSDTNTLYIGQRSNTVEHTILADKHGFNIKDLAVPFIVADGLTGRNYTEIPVNGRHFRSVKIASDFVESDAIVVLSHLTGHCQAGIGGGLKNIGMGCASRRGKLEQHSKVHPNVTADKCVGCELCKRWCPANAIVTKNKKAIIVEETCIGCGECIVVCRNEAIKIDWNQPLMGLQEKMAEYAAAVIDDKKDKIVFINFVLNVTKDCDCMSKEEAPIMKDVGILASFDPVALDKASADLAIKYTGSDKFKQNYPKIEWQHQLNYANKIGIGNLEYEIIEV